jgi:hypothetical protein
MWTAIKNFFSNDPHTTDPGLVSKWLIILVALGIAIYGIIAGVDNLIGLSTLVCGMLTIAYGGHAIGTYVQNRTWTPQNPSTGLQTPLVAPQNDRPTMDPGIMP